MAASLTTAANVTATAPPLLSITTPWVQPSDCKTQWLNTTVSWTVAGTSMTTSTITVSAPAASCNPPGWDRFSPENRLSFSPAVCPKGWIYRWMAEDDLTGASTALCCQKGFTSNAMWFSIYGTKDCGREDWVTSAKTSRYTYMVHEGWAITWDASDTATLTPKLPTLTRSMRVPTWTPGEKIRDGRYDPHPNTSIEYFSPPVLWFLMIGMPIIGALMIGSCVWCCVRRCRRNRRAKKAAAAAREIDLSERK